ncbi:hypothetical protein MP228_003360 [Amoeboaphelidium protococcarum]|nr:hypothetical protein MP228_003360 [Amoeboaphelidium protococcarum]
MLSLGGLMYFNANHGYLEALVRGFKQSILTSTQYGNLVQCETLEDMKLQLSATEYADVLQTITGSKLRSSDLSAACLDKMVQEFKHIRANSDEPLSKFLDYITYAYMIDNIVLLITGAIHNRDTKELIERCHPLGQFESLPALSICQNVDDLYNLCIVDTPLAKYFQSFSSSSDLDEMNVEIIRNTLYKSYLEDFDRFCREECDSAETAEVMHDILEFEADRRTITITLNSLHTELSKDERLKLYPAMGKLYPDGQLKLSKCEDEDSVKIACEQYPQYRQFFDSSTSSLMMVSGSMGSGGAYGGEESYVQHMEDEFFRYEVNTNKYVFMRQFNFGVFYAYFKLKEQEIRNIVWIAECIAQGQREKINNYVPIF